MHEQANKESVERSPEKEKRKATKVRNDERKERKMSRKRVSCLNCLCANEHYFMRAHNLNLNHEYEYRH